MLDIVLDTCMDAIKILPFLFLTFLLVEYLEHKIKNKNQDWIQKAGKFGPIIGSSLGIAPQCGFSIVATNLYITRIVSLGTLIAIYLSTSDEMLPILLAQKTDFKIIIAILFFKWMIGICIGMGIDFCLRKRKREEVQYALCEHDHCHCERESVLLSSWKHTMSTFFYLGIITFIVNVLFTYYGEEIFEKLFLKGSIFSPFLSSLLGLIPSCGASIMLTELYLEGAITFSSCIAGLLTGSGTAFLVLFKNNKNIKENIFILAIVYGAGAGIGFILEILLTLL